MAIRKNAAIARRPEDVAEQLAKDEADDDGGYRREHDEAEDAAVRLERGALRIDDRAQEAQPVAPEIDEQRDRRAQMHHHEIRQEVRGLLVDRPVQQARRNHGVAEAADREKFGNALQQGHDDGLQRGQSGSSATREKDLAARATPDVL